jgi:hypothetical protein
MFERRLRALHSVRAWRRWRWRPLAFAALILQGFASTITPQATGGCATAPRSPGWSDSDIAEAAAAREKLLADYRFDAEAKPPILQGPCGIAAPIRLRGLRGWPSVEFSPPPTIARPAALALDSWLASRVQPAAREILGAPVTRIFVVASYDCRTRNSDPWEKLSSHALGAAVDISGFVTVRGDRIMVKHYWPPFSRTAAFLRRVYHGACGIFGIVLGPETNALHRNHFHLEVQQRDKPYCR